MLDALLVEIEIEIRPREIGRNRYDGVKMMNAYLACATECLRMPCTGFGSDMFVWVLDGGGRWLSNQLCSI
jgi:hypothetical protein